MVLGVVKIMRFCRKLITKGGISDIKNSHKIGNLVSNFLQKRGNKSQIFLLFICKPAKNNLMFIGERAFCLEVSFLVRV